MGERDLLVLTEETHRVHTGDGATAQRVHPDLAGIARADHALAAEDGMIVSATPRSLLLDHGVEQQLRRPAGSVHLLIVMRLGDLHVKARQLAHGLGGQVPERRHADGVVARMEHRGHLPQSVEQPQLLLGITRGPAHQRGSGPAHVGVNGIERGRVGEVDDGVRGGSGRELIQLEAHLGRHAEDGRAVRPAGRLGRLPDKRAHAARADDDDANHCGPPSR